MRVAFLTLGCKVNSYETEKMKTQFEQEGHSIVSFQEKAQVYIVNTCTVTNIADRKSRQMLHRAKKNNPEALVVAAGCYVDTAKMKNEVDEMVDLFITNQQKNQIVKLVCEALPDQQPECCASRSKAAREQEHTRAYIKVQDGCNQFCSYCIIPFARGNLVSRRIQEVVHEVTTYASAGCKEVVITGIHLSSYGVTEQDARAFLKTKGEPLLDLLTEINQVEGIERIRLGSLEPRIITKEFATKLAGISKLCPHFHLSLQSGCDETLQRMNRHYTTKEYQTGVQLLREVFLHPAITTDIIVGFPEETEEEFQTTLQFAQQISFAQIHVFKYSRRKGTVADRLPGQLTEQQKSERSDRLLELEATLKNRYQELFLGKTEHILVEEMMPWQGKNYLVGYTTRYVRVAVELEDVSQEKQYCNQILSVQIVGHLKEDILLAIKS